MDWFERITGFEEVDYDATQARLSVVNGRLHSTGGSKTFGVGQLETPSLADMRRRVADLPTQPGRPEVSCVRGDTRSMHRDKRNAGSLFQVASQFNLLEMVSESVTPEKGVTRYQTDATQGPACAIAAGAGTIYRNYLVPVDGQPGQRKERQIDCLCDVGDALGNVGNHLWTMRNGYCMVTDESLAAIDEKLAMMEFAERDALKGLMRIGLHRNVEVTDEDAGHSVSQVYCSALPVRYNHVRKPEHWVRFATLVLEAAYEATLLSAVIGRATVGPPVVFLTRLGGGAFGNDAAWIEKAVRLSLVACKDHALDVRIVSHGKSAPEMLALAEEWRAVR